MPVRFASPEWFILVPVLIVAGWYWRGLRLWRPLRFGVLFLILLALAGLQVRRLGDGLDLWLLVDRSISAEDLVRPRIPEIQALLERSKGSADRIHVVEYAQHAQMRGQADEIAENQKHETRTALAVQYALSRMDRDRAARLLLVTDGFSTESMDGVAERLKRQETPMDIRVLTAPGAVDYRIADLQIPMQVQLNEPFLVDVSIAGSPDGMVKCEVLRNGKQIGKSDVQITKGKGTVRFSDRLPAGGYEYSVRVNGPGDSRPGNDHWERWIEVKGGPRVLLLSAYPDDPIRGVLAAQGFDVEMETEPEVLHPGRLTGLKGLLIHNLPANRFPAEFLKAIPFFVQAQGNGLLMVGGKSSFGSGGYFESPLDPLLPVSMELRTEHRKLSIAIAVVLDRSGSMSAAVSGNIQKIDLADEGAARCVELLSGQDAVTVFAVDTSPHCIVPLSRVDKNQEQIGAAIRTIGSTGGGICVPTGLRAAWKELKNATAGQRHIVLFADANDATQELGDYKTLMSDLVADGITVSVIGLGDRKDSGGNFLEEIATLGKGRIFFNADPMQLPALFAQETVAIARSTFVTEATAAEPANGWAQLSSKPMQWLDGVDGYNLSYLRPNATAALISKDEYQAPLVAFWNCGAGRTTAIAFPLGGAFSERARNWPRYGDFVQTATRWLMGNAVPPGLGLRQRMDGTDLVADLYYDSSWQERFSVEPPKLILSEGAAGKPFEAIWERIAPGQFTARTHMHPGAWMRGALKAGTHTIAFGPVNVPGSVEWRSDPRRLEELRAVSKATGGQERLDLSGVWTAPRRSAWRSMHGWLLAGALLLYLAEALIVRLGFGAAHRNGKIAYSSSAHVAA